MHEKKTKIVIVDDEPPIVELLDINLKNAGYETILASGGEEAVSKIISEKPDLVILDILMEPMDGWEVCKIIKDHHDLKDVKIVMLTAKDQERDKMIGKEVLKADEYVVMSM
jgi:DNA-binding response OmpR family regulator